MSEADPDPGQVAGVAAMFDGLADGYDQSGVAYYTLIAEGLVARLDVRPGERVLDVGAGRGAATFPLADAVGPDGRVDAIDVAEAMVRLLARDAAGRPQVHAAVGDATDPRPAGAPYDVVAACLVLFFLPDPVAALSRWHALLRRGGRLGIATFQPSWGAWAALDGLYREYAGAEHASASQEDAFRSDSGVERMLSAAGFGGVRTELVTHQVRFADVEEWVRWSRSGTVMGGIWTRTPEAAHPEILRRATEVLEATRDDDGRLVLEVGARYTFGVGQRVG